MAGRCSTAMVVSGAEVRKKVLYHIPLCRVWAIKTGGFRVSKGCLEDFLKSKNLALDVLLVPVNASGHRRIVVLSKLSISPTPLPLLCSYPLGE
jgi:hypothetical protein